MSSPELFREFLSQASSSGSKSTALQPLGWLVSMLISGVVAAAIWGAPEWLLIVLSIFLAIVVITFISIYVMFAHKNPDALRSEKYTLSKMAIEKNLIGDDTSGLFEVSENNETSMSQANLPEQEGNDE